MRPNFVNCISIIKRGDSIVTTHDKSGIVLPIEGATLREVGNNLSKFIADLRCAKIVVGTENVPEPTLTLIPTPAITETVNTAVVESVPVVPVLEQAVVDVESEADSNDSWDAIANDADYGREDRAVKLEEHKVEAVAPVTIVAPIVTPVKAKPKVKPTVIGSPKKKMR